MNKTCGCIDCTADATTRIERKGKIRTVCDEHADGYSRLGIWYDPGVVEPSYFYNLGIHADAKNKNVVLFIGSRRLRIGYSDHRPDDERWHPVVGCV